MKSPRKQEEKPPVGNGRAMLRDVARESGVSISTVSIVLNDSPLAQKLSPTTRARVAETARRLRYSPDPMARSLKKRQSQTIGVMIFDIADPYCTRLLKGIEEAMESTTFLPLIMSVQNKTETFRRYSRLVEERRIEGLILVPNWTTADRKMLVSFAQTPCVTIEGDPSVETMSHVLVDNVGGGFRAIEHLHELGHRKIAVLRGPKHIRSSMERWEGIQNFARHAGLKIDPGLVMQMQNLPEANSTFLEGYRLTRLLIEGGRSFTALVAFDDLTAAGAIRAFHEAGWQIPGRCSVIGFDDVPNAEFISPALTTMRQPLEEMGRLSVELLLATIEEKDATRKPRPLKMLGPALRVRSSTGPVQ